MIDRRSLMLSTAVLGLAGPSAAAPSKALGDVLDAIGQESLDRSPELATNFGLDKGARAAQKRQLDDRSLAAREKDAGRHIDELKRLHAVDRKSLTGLDAINYDVVDFQFGLAVEGERKFKWGNGLGNPYVLSQLSGAYQALPDFLDSQHAIETADDAEAYLARLGALPRVLDQEIEAVRFDADRGVIPPDFALDRTLSQLTSLRDAPASQATLVQSLVRRTRDKGLAGDWGQRAADLYTRQVQPALNEQIALVKSLRGRAGHDAGAWKLPDGGEFYRLSLEGQTSSKMTPAEVHRIGQDMVRDLASQMDAIFKAQGMTRGTTGERLQALFADAKYRYPNTDDGKAKLIADLDVKRADMQARLPRYFGVLPKTALAIRRVPREIELGQPLGYYQNATLDGARPGAFYINLRDTSEAPTWTLPTLFYHEGIPGHHMQISIQQEQPLPFIRQVLGFNAYVEGWALYAEQLADEIGVYADDPFGRIGYLNDAMLRAVRLVVDTGMHELRWSREQALKFYMDARGEGEAASATEIERYAVWPGQACGYMVGKLSWLRNRQKAKDALGPRFDIRAFHDAGLTSGAVPLAVLDRVIDGYIKTQG